MAVASRPGVGARRSAWCRSSLSGRAIAIAPTTATAAGSRSPRTGTGRGRTGPCRPPSTEPQSTRVDRAGAVAAIWIGAGALTAVAAFGGWTLTSMHHEPADEVDDRDAAEHLPGAARRRDRLVLGPVQDHDDEDEQHHDRAGVDQHLDHGQEVRVQHHVDGADPEEAADHAHHRGDQVAARDRRTARHRPRPRRTPRTGAPCPCPWTRRDRRAATA